MNPLRFAVLLLLLTGCASNQPSPPPLASSLPTPSSLKPGALWSFVLLNGDGGIAATLVVRLSDESINTCESGDYRRLEILSKSKTSAAILENDAAYQVMGAALRIQLSTGLCDNGYAIIGEVRGGGFEGTHMEEVLVASRATRHLVQRVYGVPLPLMPNTSLERTRER